MQFIIDEKSLDGIFALPSRVVDENLKLASSVQIKTVLYFFRAASMGLSLDVKSISRGTGFDENETEDALLFWEERGIVKRVSQKDENNVQIKTNVTNVAASVAENEEQKSPNKPTVAPLPLSKPTVEQIGKRCDECPMLKELFFEVQNILGRTIGYDGQSVLLMLHDTYNLPFEVILMLVEHLKSKNKAGVKDIARLGQTWAENEILTIESAEDFILKDREVDKIWGDFAHEAGLLNTYPTKKQKKFFLLWSNDFKFSVDVILMAYEISVENCRDGKWSLEYMNKVLSNWHDNGLSSVSDVTAFLNKKGTNGQVSKKGFKGSQKSEPEKATSFDIDKIISNSIL